MADSKVAWFAAGLGLGAALGMLFAPQSGEETRELLTRKANEGREVLGRKSEEIRQQANEYVDRGRQVVNRQVDQFQAAVDAGKQAFREASRPESSSVMNE